MRAMLRIAMGVVALGVLSPVPASAVTIEQIVGLAKAGVTETIILALIDRDRTVFSIEPEQIVKLQRDGLSEAVILAMLKSGRAEGDEAARADAAHNAAFIASSLSPGPELVIVGHGPERPNVPQRSFYASPPATFVLPVPYGASYDGPSVRSSMRHRGTRFSGARGFNEPRALCYASVNTARSVFPLTYVTECPAVMQQRRPR